MEPIAFHKFEGFRPQNPQDKALLYSSDGILFNNTVFPSGWRSPNYNLMAFKGLLLRPIDETK